HIQMISILNYIYHIINSSLFFFTAPPTTEISPLSLHDALPISSWPASSKPSPAARRGLERSPKASPLRCLPLPGMSSASSRYERSEEHTSELQSRENLVCRLLLEKKKKKG